MKNLYLALTRFILSLLIIFSAANSANAILHDRGNGLIYDDILNITWMQNANYADGTMKWEDAMILADNLVFADYNDWRLPKSDASCSGRNCTGSEMGHLFYHYGVTSDYPKLFLDVKPSMYWSSTESNEDSAIRFNFKAGRQDTSFKKQKRYPLFVRDGDSPVAPEPISSLLFIIGGAMFGARKFMRK